MSTAPNDPHQSLAVDQASPIAREDPGPTCSDADSGSHSQDSSFASDGPLTPKDEDFAHRGDKVAIASAPGAVTAIHEPQQKGELVEPDDDDEEEDDDDDDDGFIPRGVPTRPTGSGGSAGARPVKAR